MIESWLPDGAWPQPILDAIGQFRQGHVLKWDSVAFGAAFKHALCKPTLASGRKGTGFVKQLASWPFVMITSQTCDICEDGRHTKRFPWVSVVPVYNIAAHLRDDGQRHQIRTNRFLYLMALSGPTFSKSGQLWIADFRIEYPLEKSVLVLQAPIEAFDSEDGYQFLADRLATRRNRPAIDTRVRDFILRPLDEAIRSGTLDHSYIREMRIQCGPAWDKVERARLVALIDDASQVDDVATAFDRWEQVVAQSLPSDLSLMPTSIVPYDSFSYVESLRSQALDYTDAST